MELGIIQNEPGIAQAWLMATVGPKSHKRQLRKTISEVSIPKVCEVLCSGTPLLLRVTSSLLYGISLLFKQKVGLMATDVSLIFDRISSLISTYSVDSPTCSSTATVQMEPGRANRRSYLADDPTFLMETDFVLEWKESCAQLAGSVMLSNILAIQKMDNYLNGRETSPQPNLLVDAEARDRSFAEYLDRTNNTTVVLGHEEMGDLDFEFDEDGNIITFGNEESVNVLADLNFDEDFSASAAVVEDLSKSVNSISNDPNFDILNQSEATVVTKLAETDAMATRRSRKRRLVVDSITSSSSKRGFERRVTLDIGAQIETGRNSDSEAILNTFIGLMSSTQPQFVNLCYRLVLGPQATNEISFEALPLAQRHPAINNLESFLKEIDDIERGRNVRSRRPSVSLAEALTPGSEENPFGAIDFALDSMEEEEEQREDCLDSKKLEAFEQFLRDRARRCSNSSSVTFDRLIPSGHDRGELVLRKMAAQSFVSVLELATRSIVDLSVGQGNEFGHPSNIHISFRN